MGSVVPRQSVEYDEFRCSSKEFKTLLDTATFSAFHSLGGANSPVNEPLNSNLMVFGPQGVGKTQISMENTVKTLSEMGLNPRIYYPGIKKETEKDVLILQISCAHSDAMDVSGVQTFDSEGNTAYAVPEKFKTAATFPGAIYVLDEINRSNELDHYLSLVNEGYYAETRLTEKRVVIATANEGIDKTIVRKLDKAALGRWTLSYLRSSAAEWLDYARDKGIMQEVAAFVRIMPQLIDDMVIVDHPNTNSPSPRNFERLSNELKKYCMARAGLEKMKENVRSGSQSRQVSQGEDEDVSGVQHKWDDSDIPALTRYTYGNIGMVAETNQFAQFVVFSYKTVVPAIQKIIQGKGMDAELLSMLNNSWTSGSVSGNSEALKKREYQYAFIEYLPVMMDKAFERIDEKFDGMVQKEKVAAKVTEIERARANTKGGVMDNVIKALVGISSDARIQTLSAMQSHKSGLTTSIMRLQNDPTFGADIKGVLNSLKESLENYRGAIETVSVGI